MRNLNCGLAWMREDGGEKWWEKLTLVRENDKTCLLKVRSRPSNLVRSNGPHLFSLLI